MQSISPNLCPLPTQTLTSVSWGPITVPHTWIVRTCRGLSAVSHANSAGRDTSRRHLATASVSPDVGPSSDMRLAAAASFPWYASAWSHSPLPLLQISMSAWAWQCPAPRDRCASTPQVPTSARGTTLTADGDTTWMRRAHAVWVRASPVLSTRGSHHRPLVLQKAFRGWRLRVLSPHACCDWKLYSQTWMSVRDLMPPAVDMDALTWWAHSAVSAILATCTTASPDPARVRRRWGLLLDDCLRGQPCHFGNYLQLC